MVTLFCCIILVPLYLAEWITSTLPRSIGQFAIGVYQESIIMIGGYPYPQQMMQFDITNNKLIDNGTSVLSNSIAGYAQYFTQIGNMIYIKDFRGTRLSVYDLSTNQLTWNRFNISIQFKYGAKECLASTKDYLFIIGGVDSSGIYLNKVQMLNMSTKIWTNVSDMNENRARPSCIVAPTTNILFVIGGAKSYNTYSKTIETIETNDITHKTWKYYSNLTVPTDRAKSVWYDHKIFVIGGLYASNKYSDTMHIINTMEETVSTEDGPYLTEAHGVIIFDSTLYIFGGFYSTINNYLNKWAYYNLPTSSPSISTTIESNQSNTTHRPIHTTTFTNISSTIESTNTTRRQIHTTTFTTLAPEEKMRNPMNIPTVYIITIVFALFAWFAIIALLDAKFIHKTDYYLPMNIAAVAFEVMDTVLDMIFVVLLFNHYLINPSIDILIATILSFVFIVFPISFSIFQLTHEEKINHWLDREYLTGWLLDHKWKLLVLCVITGSSFAAVELVNCGAFNLELFNMRLNKQERIKFNTKRIIGIICFENIPQTGIQIWYLVKFRVELIPILSIIFAIASIFITILAKCTQNSIITNSKIARITFDVTGHDIKSKLSRKTNGIKKKVCRILEMQTQNLIDIPKPFVIDEGIRFEIFIFMKDITNKNFQSHFNTSVENGRLLNIIQNEWETKTVTNVTNVKYDNNIQNTDSGSETIYIPVNATNDSDIGE